MVDVRYWPLADNPPPLALVRYWTKADMRPVPYGEVHMVALEAFRWGLDRSGSMEYATFRSGWPNMGVASMRSPKSAEKVMGL
jgi:hypothetical protein